MAQNSAPAVCSLQAFLINGDPGILTHLTLHKVAPIYGGILSLDSFPSLVHLDLQGCCCMKALIRARPNTSSTNATYRAKFSNSAQYTSIKAPFRASHIFR